MDTCKDVEALAGKLAAADGRDFGETCGFDKGEDDCDSDICVAAHHEDHDAECAREWYRRYARTAIKHCREMAA